jgi:hypothetical protein
VTAFVGFWKGACHLSFLLIRKLFRDVLKMAVSRRLLAKAVSKVTPA